MPFRQTDNILNMNTKRVQDRLHENITWLITKNDRITLLNISRNRHIVNDWLVKYIIPRNTQMIPLIRNYNVRFDNHPLKCHQSFQCDLNSSPLFYDQPTFSPFPPKSFTSHAVPPLFPVSVVPGNSFSTSADQVDTWPSLHVTLAYDLVSFAHAGFALRVWLHVL